MSPEEFKAWLQARIGEAERKKLAPGTVAGSLVCATRPAVGRRVGETAAGGIYVFTVDEVWGLLGRLERQIEAAELAGELVA